jgi:hypothetical protein
VEKECFMAEEKKQEKKLIIDEDWKNQAQKEKENLAEKEENSSQISDAFKGPRAAD